MKLISKNNLSALLFCCFFVISTSVQAADYVFDGIVKGESGLLSDIKVSWIGSVEPMQGSQLTVDGKYSVSCQAEEGDKVYTYFSKKEKGLVKSYLTSGGIYTEGDGSLVYNAGLASSPILYAENFPVLVVTIGAGTVIEIEVEGSNIPYAYAGYNGKYGWLDAPEFVEPASIKVLNPHNIVSTPLAFTVGSADEVLLLGEAQAEVAFNADFSDGAPYLAKFDGKGNLMLDDKDLVKISAIEGVKNAYVAYVDTLEKYQVVIKGVKGEDDPDESIRPEDTEALAAWWYMNSDDDDPCFIGSAASVSPMLLVALSSMLALVVRRRK